MSDSRSNFLERVLGWLRAGYPAGMPRQDYVVLLGLLRRALTEDEVRRIAHHLADHLLHGSDRISRQDIEEMISHEVLQEASEQDLMRVSARLAAGGWPLAEPPASLTAT